MDILKLLEAIERPDGENDKKLSPRREVVKDLFKFGKKVSLAVLPFTLGTAFQKANAQTTNTIEVDSLNLLLGIEYLQYEFYNYALTQTTTLIPVAAIPAITAMRSHQKSYIDFLVSSITALGGTPRIQLVYANFEYRIIATRNATTNVPLTYVFAANAVMSWVRALLLRSRFQCLMNIMKVIFMQGILFMNFLLQERTMEQLRKELCLTKMSF
ncbi:MAG: ferritin-like domain-containing protein [Pedobacter sp.]|uniref:ferritin-like domain-containing protein n=1 Tax=Pedobacter sp. TaxID=1411316 RepID=UPI003562E660